jgi:hypothetical protein
MRLLISGRLTAAVVFAIILLAPGAAAAQQPPDPPLPCPVKEAKTKQRLTALPARVIEPQRTAEGWPDLQGMWTSAAYPGGAMDSIEMGWDPEDLVVRGVCGELITNVGPNANLLVDPMRGLIPYQPWAKQKQMELRAAMYAPVRRMDLDVDVRCFPRGVPKASTFGNFEIRYIPGFVLLHHVSGEHYTWRIVPMDGRPHLREQIKLYMGDSVGRWEGNTLVVETTNNRDGTWFDKHATFHSENMRVTERFTLVDANTLYFEATIEDPSVFTQPWKIAVTYDRRINVVRETQETTCHEGGERFLQIMLRAGTRAQAAGFKGYHIHIDRSGKAVQPEEQKYVDQTGQRSSYASTVLDGLADTVPAPPQK